MMKKMMISLLTACATLSAAPEAIVFDFGGVMTKEPNREAVVQFLCKSFALSPQEFEAVNQEKRKAIKTGKRDQDFWLEYARQKNISLPKGWEDSFNHVMKDAIGVNHEMYDLVLELKGKGIPVALLSNIDDRLARIIREFNLYAPFDPCLLSCEIGLEKPDPKIYEFLLKEMELPASSIIFIDDRAENIEAAQKLGFDAILFTSQNQLQKELKKRGLLG
jgi:putative hydrolase of the HAD superfamily